MEVSLKRSMFTSTALAVLMVAPAVQADALKLSGAGGSLIYPLASRWFSDYGKLVPNVQINYRSIGSGAGIRQFSQDRTVDFGETDVPMTDQQLRDSKVKPVMHLPMALGGVVPVYNLPLGGIRFAGDTLAAIYLGKVARWDDPAIARDNPGLKLPAGPITVV